MMTETDPRRDERAFVDSTDYADLDLAPAGDVRVTRTPAPRSTFALRLDGETIEELREIAARQGTRPTQLARDWIIERLEKERQADAVLVPMALLRQLAANGKRSTQDVLTALGIDPAKLA